MVINYGEESFPTGGPQDIEVSMFHGGENSKPFFIATPNLSASIFYLRPICVILCINLASSIIQAHPDRFPPYLLQFPLAYFYKHNRVYGMEKGWEALLKINLTGGDQKKVRIQ